MRGKYVIMMASESEGNMKNKIKIFSSGHDGAVERGINEWLYEYDDIEVIDIKYSISNGGSYTQYSALVFYMTREREQ